ncbi:MAG: amidohydrolase family protein [Chitinophagaceae bacterium]|nr:amidohydrolase family protein [Chitinophagaceae bacterium]
MIVDAHQHFWKFDAARHQWITEDMKLLRRDYLPQDLLAIYKKLNIGGCIAVQADESDNETSFLLELAAKNDFIEGVVGWINPKDNLLEEKLNQYSKQSILKGFRNIIQGRPDDFYLTNPDFHQFLKELKIYNFTYDVLVFEDQLRATIKCTEKFPDQKFILDHCGKPNIKAKNHKNWASNIKILASNPNMYCKLSGLVTEANLNSWTYDDLIPYMEITAEHFGSERLCFGSDWPVCLLASDYERLYEVTNKFIGQLTAKEQENILGINVCRFYGIK